MGGDFGRGRHTPIPAISGSACTTQCFGHSPGIPPPQIFSNTPNPLLLNIIITPAETAAPIKRVNMQANLGYVPRWSSGGRGS